MEWRWELVLATERGRGSAFCSAPRLVTASGEATARPTANQMEEKLVKLSALERVVWLGPQWVHKSEGALESSKARVKAARLGAQSAVEWGRVWGKATEAGMGVGKEQRTAFLRTTNSM